MKIWLWKGSSTLSKDKYASMRKEKPMQDEIKKVVAWVSNAKMGASNYVGRWKVSCGTEDETA